MPPFADIVSVAVQVFVAGIWAVLWSELPAGVATPAWMRPAYPKKSVMPAVFSSVLRPAANLTNLTNITSLSLVSTSPGNELDLRFTDFGTAGFPKAPSPLLIGLIFCLFFASFVARITASKAWFRFQLRQRKAPTTTSSGTQTTASMMPASLKYVVTASAAPTFVFGGAPAAERDEITKLRNSLNTTLNRITALEAQTREVAQLRTWNANARARITELEAEARRPTNIYATDNGGQTRDIVWQVSQPRVGYGVNNYFPEPINRAEMEIWLSMHPRSGGGYRGGRGGLGGRGNIGGRGGHMG